MPLTITHLDISTSRHLDTTNSRRGVRCTGASLLLTSTPCLPPESHLLDNAGSGRRLSRFLEGKYGERRTLGVRDSSSSALQRIHAHSHREKQRVRWVRFGVRRRWRLVRVLVDLTVVPEAVFISNLRPNPPRLSSRTTADLRQPPIRATAAVCRRPLGRGTDPNGQTMTILSEMLAKKTPGTSAPSLLPRHPLWRRSGTW